jgi:hypothetical protein
MNKNLIRLECSEDEWMQGYGALGSRFKPPASCMIGRCPSGGRVLPEGFTVTDLMKKKFAIPCGCRGGRPGARAKAMVAAMEGRFDHPDGGSYAVKAEVRFNVDVAVREVRADAVFFDANGTEVLALELDGGPHFGPVDFGQCPSDEQMAAVFAKRKEYDRAKDKYWENKGVATLHVAYAQFDSAFELVKAALGVVKAKGSGIVHLVTDLELYASVGHSENVTLLKHGP